MAHYHDELLLDLNGRLSGDPTLVGLLTNGADSVASVEASPDDAAPYVLIDIVDESTEDEAFDTLVRTIVVAVTLLVPRKFETEPAAERRTKMIDRVDGDWYLQANNTPTFGLDRYTPTLPSWDCSPLQFLGAGFGPDKPNQIGNLRQYVCKVSKLQPSA